MAHGKKDENQWKQWIGQTVCRHYLILEKLDSGSFGYVFKAKRDKDPNNKHINSQGDDLYAVKIEDNTVKSKDTLTKEAKILFDLKAEKGFTRMYYYIKSEKINTMVTTLLDKSLEKLFVLCKKKFTLKTVLMIADQMLSRLQYFHQKGYVHRDIKPDNFMIGRGTEKNQIFLIDFGLSKSYLKKNGQHIEFSDKVGLVGTTRYTSIQSHQGMEQSRRDDLESLGYTLIYFLKGHLPWMNLHSTNKQEHQKLISTVKQRTPLLELCKDIPVEFHKYMSYVLSMGFFDEPNYNYLKRLFRTLFLQENFQYDDKYDWIKDDPANANEKRNMFEKFKSVNPAPVIKFELDSKEFRKEDSMRIVEEGTTEIIPGTSIINTNNNPNQTNNANNYNYNNSMGNSNLLEVGFKRKNTRKSTQEYKKPVEYEIKDEDEADYQEELIDNVYDLSNQVSKGLRQNEGESSEFDPNKVNSINSSKQNTINLNNFKLHTDKQSTADINDFELDGGEENIPEEGSTPAIMIKNLAKIQMVIKRFHALTASKRIARASLK